MDSESRVNQIDPTLDLTPTPQIDPTIDLDYAAKHREWSKQWRANNPEKSRAYNKQWRSKNPDKVREYNRKYSKKRGPQRWQAEKARGHEKARQQFDLERAAETQRHLQMKAAQLRKSILRSGEYADTIWLGDIMGDLVRYVADHVPIDDRDDMGEPAFLDLSWAA